MTTVRLDPIPASAPLRPVKLASIAYDKEGTGLVNVGTFAWGRFDDDDQTNIARSLESTLQEAIAERPPSGPAINVHIVIRTYVLFYSGREGATIAGIDWAAAEADDRVLFQDTFYAAYHCGRFPDICTLGMNKDRVHEGLVRRVAQDALAIASGASPGVRKAERTYSDFEEAAAVVPPTLGGEGEFLPDGLSGRYAVGPVTMPVERARMWQPIDWTRRLAGLPQPEPPAQEDWVNCSANGERRWAPRSSCD